jgi:putative addiction module component (TIGR02574 family)
MELSAEDRLRLADELYESVEDELPADDAWRAAWAAELTRRISEIRTGAVEGLDGEQVLDEERARLATRRR